MSSFSGVMTGILHCWPGRSDRQADCWFAASCVRLRATVTAARLDVEQLSTTLACGLGAIPQHPGTRTSIWPTKNLRAGRTSPNPPAEPPGAEVGPSCRVSLVRLPLLLPHRDCSRSTGRAARFRLEHIRGPRGPGGGFSILLPRDHWPAWGGGRDIRWRPGRTASRLGAGKDRRASAWASTGRKPGARRRYDPLRIAPARTGTDWDLRVIARSCSRLAAWNVFPSSRNGSWPCQTKRKARMKTEKRGQDVCDTRHAAHRTLSTYDRAARLTAADVKSGCARPRRGWPRRGAGHRAGWCGLKHGSRSSRLRRHRR